MKNKSIWQLEQTNNNTLQNNDIPKETDILIIGAGITGITTAYLLKNTNKKITIIDKSVIGNCTTGKSTAKISYLQGIIYQTLNKKINKEIAKKNLDSNIDAINIIKKK